MAASFISNLLNYVGNTVSYITAKVNVNMCNVNAVNVMSKTLRPKHADESGWTISHLYN